MRWLSDDIRFHFLIHAYGSYVCGHLSNVYGGCTTKSQAKYIALPSVLSLVVTGMIRDVYNVN